MKAIVTMFAILVLATSAIPAPRIQAAPAWLPVEKSDLDASASKIDPDASAEILYRLEEIDDKAENSITYRSYQRIKVYNEKGVPELNKIDINSSDTAKLKNVSARVIKPDGSIVNIEQKDFYTRDIVRQGRQSLKVTSFAFPSLTAGCIIEWQSESVSKEAIYAQRVVFQGAMPTRLFRVRYRPYPVPGGKFENVFNNCRPATAKLGKDHYYTIEMTGIPALKTEPLMPPVDQVQQWAMFYMSTPFMSIGGIFNDQIMTPLGESVERFARPLKKSRTRDPIKAKADELTAGVTGDREKLARIHDFCRSSIRNTARESSGFTRDELDKLKESDLASQVLEYGYGTRYEITALFIALARAAGYNAWIALCSDRSERIFSMRFLMISIPTDLIACVTLGQNEYYYDPASVYLPAEKLHWFNQGTGVCCYRRDTMITQVAKGANGTVVIKQIPDDPRAPLNPRWSNTASGTAADAQRKRTGTFRLDADGTLEGDVRLEPRGQYEVAAKNRYDSETAEARAASVRDDILERLPNAEVTDITVRNASSPLDPIAITYHIRVPGYAETTGQRMFFQPAFFQKNTPAMFTAAERTHPVYLQYPWSEDDDVSITMPEGYTIEEMSRIEPTPKSNTYSYNLELSVRASTRTILFKREFAFNFKQVERSGYEQLKVIFDGLHALDSTTITLKRTK